MTLITCFFLIGAFALRGGFCIWCWIGAHACWGSCSVEDQWPTEGRFVWAIQVSADKFRDFTAHPFAIIFLFALHQSVLRCAWSSADAQDLCRWSCASRIGSNFNRLILLPPFQKQRSIFIMHEVAWLLTCLLFPPLMSSVRHPYSSRSKKLWLGRCSSVTLAQITGRRRPRLLMVAELRHDSELLW